MKRIMMVMLGAMLATAPAMAQSRPNVRPVKASEARDATPATGRVSVQVQVVHANNTKQMDPQLRNVADQLSFLNYSGFKLLDTHNAKLGAGQDASFTLAGGRRLQVKLVSRDARGAKVRVIMQRGREVTVDTTVNIHRNRSFIIAGPNHEGGKLVLPLTVRY